MKTKNFDEIPLGFYIFRAFYRSLGKEIDLLSIKIDGRPWVEQPSVPTYSRNPKASGSFGCFWKWADESLPVFEYPGVI